MCHNTNNTLNVQILLLVARVPYPEKITPECELMAFKSVEVAIIITALLDVLLLILVAMLWVYDCMLVSMIQEQHAQ